MTADLLIVNAAEVVTCGGAAPKIGEAMRDLKIIENGAVACEAGTIVWVGETPQIPSWVNGAKVRIDARGKAVMPGLVDCHTHLVFGGSREEEFAMKLQGVPYLEILKQGGGILDTVAKTRSASQKQLFERGLRWLDEAMRCGTTTIEIKSGYGLSFGDEMKILRVIRELQRKHPIGIAATFLGAHAFPKNKERAAYILEVLRMIEKVGREDLAEFCDVFCEENAFSLAESRLILEEALSCGMKLKIHAGEFNDLGGADLAAELGAVSLDHGEHLSERGISLLAKNRIPIVLMPGVNFHLGSQPADARKLIESGVPVALASDFNPGSSPVLSMQVVIQLACRMYKMTPEEVISAATINSAYALDLADRIGSIEQGKQADLLILDIPTFRQLPYWIGRNIVQTVIKNGEMQ